jgi:hypothetical protein
LGFSGNRGKIEEHDLHGVINILISHYLSFSVEFKLLVKGGKLIVALNRPNVLLPSQV